MYELWFKELLHELDYASGLLRRHDGTRALHTLKRILTVLKVMVAQLDILETMTPLEFLSFRDRLDAGSGFQSHQFRELEFTLGWKDPKALDRYPAGTEVRRQLERRLAASTLWDAFCSISPGAASWCPGAELSGTRPGRRPSPALQAVLVDIYGVTPP